MKKGTLILSFCLVFSWMLTGQRGLAGTWEGTITHGGIYSEEGVRFELFLKKMGRKWIGRAVIHESDTTTVEMNLIGSFYEDRSMYMIDTEFVPFEPDDPKPGFFRKYQFLYHRSIEGNTLNGYWQDDFYGPLEIKMRRGRVFLKKVQPPSKA